MEVTAFLDEYDVGGLVVAFTINGRIHQVTGRYITLRTIPLTPFRTIHLDYTYTTTLVP
jgi:hypothetical protein